MAALISRINFETLQPATLESPDAAWKNNSGLATQAILDLAYLHTLKLSQQPADSLDPSQRRDMKMIMSRCGKMSMRLRLLQRSSNLLRLGLLCAAASESSSFHAMILMADV